MHVQLSQLVDPDQHGLQGQRHLTMCHHGRVGCRVEAQHQWRTEPSKHSSGVLHCLP